MQESTAMRNDPNCRPATILIRERPMRTTDEMARRQPKISAAASEFLLRREAGAHRMCRSTIPRALRDGVHRAHRVAARVTFLRCLNRMNDLIDGTRVEGQILLDGRRHSAGRKVDVVELRKRVGMVFQKSNPFPKSIFENVAYGPRVAGIRRQAVLYEIVEKSLTRAALWEEVKDRLDDSALQLSGGQQQRLCIARALATESGRAA